MLMEAHPAAAAVTVGTGAESGGAESGLAPTTPMAVKAESGEAEMETDWTTNASNRYTNEHLKLGFLKDTWSNPFAAVSHTMLPLAPIISFEAYRFVRLC